MVSRAKACEAQTPAATTINGGSEWESRQISDSATTSNAIYQFPAVSGDGVSNADEVAAGTDPMDSDSIPATEPPMPVTTLPTFALLLLSLLLGLFGYRRLAH